MQGGHAPQGLGGKMGKSFQRPKRKKPAGKRRVKPGPKRANAYALRDQHLQDLGFRTYKAYLASDLWQFTRRQVLIRDGHLCQACGRPDSYQVHHQKYTRKVLLGKDLAHLVTLCGECHTHIERDDDGVKITKIQEVRRRLAQLAGEERNCGQANHPLRPPSPPRLPPLLRGVPRQAHLRGPTRIPDLGYR